MSIGVSVKKRETSKYDRAIKAFGRLRDIFDWVAKILELIRTAEYLHTEDREYLNEKLDDMKVRAEELRIEKLKKPEYVPPATKDEICLHEEKLNPPQEAKTVKPAISSFHDFLGYHWWYDLNPGDIVHCADEQRNYHTLSVIRNDRDEMCLRDHYSGIYSLWRVGDIMLYLAPKREMLKNKHRVDMRFL